MLNILTSNRAKSLYWRTGAMFGAGMLSLVMDNLSVLHLSPTITVFIGLVLGEVLKAINNWSQGQPMGFVGKSQ